MRVLLTAMAFSVISFLAGVAGDLSAVTAPAQAAQQAHAVRLALPAETLIEVKPVNAAPLRDDVLKLAMADAPALLPKRAFTTETAEAVLLKAPRKAEAVG